MAYRTHGSLFDESVHLLSARQSASPALLAILKAIPLSDGPSSGTDQAQFSPSFSKRSTLDGFSIWIDHRSSNRDDHFPETQRFSIGTSSAREGDWFTNVWWCFPLTVQNALTACWMN